MLVPVRPISRSFRGLNTSNTSRYVDIPVVGITPQQIAHGSLMRHLLQAVQRADVVERVDRRTEPPVQAEYLPVHQRGQRQEIEQIREVFPHGRVAVLAQAFVVEAVYLSDLTGLVVSSQDGYSLAVSDLQCNTGVNC